MTKVQLDVNGDTYHAELNDIGVVVKDDEQKFLFMVSDYSYFNIQHLSTMIRLWRFSYNQGYLQGYLQGQESRETQ